MDCFPRLASNRDPPGLCLLSSWDYRREHQCRFPLGLGLESPYTLLEFRPVPLSLAGNPPEAFRVPKRNPQPFPLKWGQSLSALPEKQHFWFW
jgi:hypothetical protein